MDELDYRTYSREQVMAHLAEIVFDIIAGNTEYHPKEALEKYATDYEVSGVGQLRFYFPSEQGGATRITLEVAREENLNENEY